MSSKDAYGRIIQADVSVIRKLLEKATVGPAIPVGNKSNRLEEIAQDMQKVLEKIDDNFAEHKKDTEKYLKEIAENSKKQVKEGKSDDCCERLIEAIKSLGKTQEGLLLDVVSNTDKTNKMTKALASNINGIGGGGGNNGGGNGGNGIGGGGNNINAAFNTVAAKKQFAVLFSYIETASMKVFGKSGMGYALDGVVESAIMFDVNMKRAAYRVEGLTKDSPALLQQWADLSKTAEGFATTGHTITENQALFQRMQKKTYMSSIKDGDKVRKLTTASAHAAYRLGANAEQTSDLFGEWHQKLRLSDRDMQGIGRHMVTLQRETGITGDEMLEVAKASESLLKNLRNQGMLSESTAKSVMSYMAQAKKLDVEEGASKIIKGLSGANSLLKETDEGTQRYLITAAARIGKVNELLNGSLVSKKGMREITSSAKANANQLLKIYNVTLDSLEDLTEGDRRLANMQFQAIYHMGIDEFARLNKAGEDATKSFSTKIDELKKKKTSFGGGTELDKEMSAKLDADIKNLMMDVGSTAVNAIAKAKGKNADEIISELSNSKDSDTQEMMRDIRDVMKEQNITYSNKEEELKGILMAQAKMIKDSGGEDLTGMAQQIDVNNKDQLTAMADKLDKARRGSEVDKSLNNSVDKVIAQLKILNDYLSKTIGVFKTALEFLDKWTGGLVTKIIELAAFIGLFGGAIIGLTGIAWKLFTGIGPLIRALTGLPGLLMAGARRLFGGRGGPPGGGIGGGGNGPVLNPSSGLNPNTGLPNNRKATLGRGATREDRLAKINETRIKKSKAPIISKPPIKQGFGSKIKGKLGGLLNFLGIAGGVTSIAQGAAGAGGGVSPDCQPVWVCNMDALSGPLGDMGNSMAQKTMDGLVLADAANDLKDAGKGLSSAGKEGGWLSKTFGKESKFGKYVTKPLSKVGTAIGSKLGIGAEAAGGGAGIISKIAGSGLGKVAGGGAKLLGKLAPILAPLIGGITGVMEDDGSGRGLVEKGLLGAVTGGSNKGSMFSGMLGVEQGGAGDEALGILGEAGTGAATGALIGSIIPGVGTAIGAAVGGVIGGGAEIYKIITSADSPLMQTVTEWGSSLWEGVKSAGASVMEYGGDALEWAKSAFDFSPIGASFNLGKEAVSYVSENWGDFTESLSNAATTVLDNAKEIGNTVLEGAKGVTSDIGNFFSNLFGFDTGAKEITQSGLANIHKGEMIIPSKEADFIRNMDKAKGTGSIGDILGLNDLGDVFGIEDLSGYLNKAFDALMHPVKAVSKPMSDVYDRVREQNASKTAEIPRSATLERMDEIAEKQLERLVSIDERMKELVALMSPSSIITSVPNTPNKKMQNSKPTHSPDYGYWPGYMTSSGMGNAHVQSDGVNT